MSSDLLLTQRQLALLDELPTAVSVGGSSGVRNEEGQVQQGSGGSEYELFHRHWHHVRSKHRQLEEKQRRSRWGWIDQVQGICQKTCSELADLQALLTELEEQRQEVVHKTTALHELCEQMVHDQEQLSGNADALAERLDIFDRVADVARILDQANVATSHNDFPAVLDQLDGSIGFLEAHPDFCQAQAYLHQFEHLRNKACISIRSALQKSLEKSMSQVEQQLRDKRSEGVIETQVFYTRFRAAALNYRPLMTLLHKRMDVHETYSVTLEELEAFYVHLRAKLVLPSVAAQLQAVLHKDLEVAELAPATRQASGYILDVSNWERQCFEAYFEIRQPQESLRTLLETVADVFYQTMRPVVLACDSVDSLREIADCLQMDVLEPQQQAGRADLVPILSVVFRLHKDVQEKLIFRVQTFIRFDIKGYEVQAADLNYPALLFNVVESGTQGEVDRQHGWFPTMQRTLSILAKIFRRLEMSTFQGLAQEAVDICITSLRQASQVLAARPIPDHGNVLGPLVQTMDSQLFLIKHLLILREQVAGFECDLVVSEKYFNFANVWEALHLRLPEGLLGILKPQLQQSQVDSKKDIEAELKAACESLITYMTANITQPLAALNQQIMDFLAASKGDRSRLKEQTFMSVERMHEIITSFLTNVRERVPFAVAHIRLYLASAAGPGVETAAAGAGQNTNTNTPSILFKPVQLRLVDTWGRLEGLLEERELDQATLERLGFMRPDALRELVSSLFDQVMEAPWADVVNAVSQVARATAVASQLPAPPLPGPSVEQPPGPARPVAQGVPAAAASSPGSTEPAPRELPGPAVDLPGSTPATAQVPTAEATTPAPAPGPAPSSTGADQPPGPPAVSVEQPPAIPAAAKLATAPPKAAEDSASAPPLVSGPAMDASAAQAAALSGPPAGAAAAAAAPPPAPPAPTPPAPTSAEGAPPVGRTVPIL